MPEIVLLGTGRALPSVTQENTYMALIGQRCLILIDCAGGPYRRLLRAGLDPGRLDSLILTHSHPDHIYGVPALFMGLWLGGKRTPLDVFGPEQTIDVVSQMIHLYRLESWPEMFEIRYHPIPLDPGASVIANAEFVITATPTSHMVPTVGLRITDVSSQRVVAYSSDTEPGPGVRLLARGAHVLIHEATGASPGHSSAGQAGMVAKEAGVERLVLVHYDAHETAPDALVAEAGKYYEGPIHAAQDFERLTW